MNKNDNLIEKILECLKQKKILSTFEKDILSTVNVYSAKPFDRKDAIQKIRENNTNYPDIFVAISTTPGIEVKPFNQVSDFEIMNNLYMQIETMYLKGIGNNNR